MASADCPPSPSHDEERILVRVMSPSAEVPDSLSFHLRPSSTIDELKAKIADTLATKPTASQQRLIYRGKLLNGNSTIGATLVNSNEEKQQSYTLHLVVTPAPASSSAASPSGNPEPFNRNTNPLASAGIPPRTSVTTTVRRGPAAFQTTTTTRVAATVRTTPAVAASILSAVNRDPAAPANPAAEAAFTTLAERIRNSPRMSTGINLPGGTPRNRDAPTHAESPAHAQFTAATSPTPAQFAVTSPTHASFPAAPSFTHLLAHPPATFTPYTIPYHPPIAPNSQILLLQDPSGRPHSLLVGPPAAPSSIPPSLLAQSLLFERELAALQHRVAALTPVAPIAPPIAVRRQIPVIRVRASHLWLALKLAVMVAIFSNGATWARTLYLSTIGLIIFAWQTGLAATYLRPLAALLTAAPPRPAQGPQGEPDPEAIARMMVRRREQEGFRGVLRGVERAAALFIASLVPGLHERHVQAVEREEREARGEGAAAAAEGVAAGEGAEGAQAPEGEVGNVTDGADERGPEQQQEQEPEQERVELDEAALRAW